MSESRDQLDPDAIRLVRELRESGLIPERLFTGAVERDEREEAER